MDVLVKILGVLVLGLGIFVCLGGLFALWLAPFGGPLFTSFLVIVLLGASAIFLGMIIDIVRGRTKSDGSHLGPLFWLTVGPIALLLPVAGIFTGYYSEKGWIAVLQAIIYVAAGVSMTERGIRLLRERGLKTIKGND